ncbi:MAG: hypothetical protein K0R34_1832 [Herbinix sp.]|jgi:hypothetical protein|nr:hypothetical protein [Herbinix sp.]
MKKNKILISIIALSLIVNIAFVSLSIYEKNSVSELRKVWTLATNNAIFLYQQYDEMNIPEAYDYAYGEFGTIFNSIKYINYGGNGELTDNQKEEISGFYQLLVIKEEFMKNHLFEIIEIVELLQEENEDAFIRMKALRESAE